MKAREWRLIMCNANCVPELQFPHLGKPPPDFVVPIAQPVSFDAHARADDPTMPCRRFVLRAVNEHRNVATYAEVPY